MNYPDSVHFLYALGNEIKTCKFGLERIEAVLARMGHPERRGRIVHVAGTNGKGSTCAMIEAGLRAAGRRVGLYTSPHLAEPTERIRIGGAPVSAASFAAAFDRVHALVEQMLAQGAIDLHTTYFETVTAMAFHIFAAAGVEDVVLEVGLGGRFDATNVVTPALCVITPVDFDHERFLGSDLAGIAREKAGILKPGVPAVFAPQRPEVQAVLDARAATLEIEVIRAGAVSGVEITARGSRFRMDGIELECPLAGEHQVQNAATAAAVLQRLGVSPTGIARATWPGRLERLAEDPEIVVDGAHNPAGARALAQYLRRFYAEKRVSLIFGVMRDKSVEEIASTLFPLAGHVIVTAPAQQRALAPESVRPLVEHPSMRTAPDLAAALAQARATSPDAIFITGSLFLVAEARAMIGAKA